MRMASRSTLRASLMTGRLEGWRLASWPACGDDTDPDGKEGTGGGPGGGGVGQGEEEVRVPGRGSGGGGGGGGRIIPSVWDEGRTCCRRAGEAGWRGGAMGGGAGWSTPGAIWSGAGGGGMAGGWLGRGGIGGGGVPRMPDPGMEEGRGGGGGGRGGGGGGGALGLRNTGVLAGDWGRLSVNPELELCMRGRGTERDHLLLSPIHCTQQ